MKEPQVQSLGQEDPLEKDMATHSWRGSCLENPMDRGAWRAIVYGVARVRHDFVIEQEEEPPNMEG